MFLFCGAEPQRGGFAPDGAAASRHPPRGQKGRDTCGFPSSLNSYLPLFLSLAQIRDRRPLRNRGTTEDFFSATDELPSESVLLSNLFAVSETVLLHRRFCLRRRDITVSRKSLARCNAWHLRIRRLIQFIFAALSANELRGTIMPRSAQSSPYV